MQFVIEEKKKITNFFNLLKSLISIQPNCHFIIQKEGWFIMQNTDLLENLDSKDLISFNFLPSIFFSQNHIDENFNNEENNNLNNNQYGDIQQDNSQSLAFELDLTKMFKTIKAVKYSLKKLTFQIEKQQNNLKFTMHVLTEEGLLSYQKDVYNDYSLAQKQGLYNQYLANFDQGKQLLLQVEGSYLKQIRDMKNLFTELKFNEFFLNISCPNQPQDQQINIQNDNIYDFDNVESTIQGSLLIPPNFLEPHIFMANKINSGKNKMEIYLQTTNIKNQFIIYAKTQSDSITFFHSFVTVSQQYDIPEQIPQQQQQIQQNQQQSNTNLFNQSYQQKSTFNQVQQQKKFQKFLPSDINSDVNLFQVPSSSESSQESEIGLQNMFTKNSQNINKPIQVQDAKQQKQQQENIMQIENQIADNTQKNTQSKNQRPKFKISQKHKASNNGVEVARKNKTDILIAPSTQQQKELFQQDNQTQNQYKKQGFQVPLVRQQKQAELLNTTQNSNIINSVHSSQYQPIYDNNKNTYFQNQQQLIIENRRQQEQQEQYLQYQQQYQQQSLNNCSFDSTDVNNYLNFMQFIKIQKQKQQRPKQGLLQFLNSKDNGQQQINNNQNLDLFNTGEHNTNLNCSTNFYNQNKGLLQKQHQNKFIRKNISYA